MATVNSADIARLLDKLTKARWYVENAIRRETKDGREPFESDLQMLTGIDMALAPFRVGEKR